MATETAPAVEPPPAAPAPQSTPAATPPSMSAAPAAEPPAPAAPIAGPPVAAPPAPAAEPAPPAGPMVNEEAIPVLSALEGIDGMDTTELAKELAEAGEGGEQPAAAPPAPATPPPEGDLPVAPAVKEVSDAKAAEAAAAATPAGTPATPVAPAPPGEGIVIENAMFKDGKWDLGASAQDIKFENIEQLNSYVKEKYTVDDPAKLFTSVDKWRNDSQALVKAEGKVVEYDNLFKGLPAELYEMFHRHTKGEDYKSVILDRPNLDFTKKTNEQSSRDLVNAYFKDQFNKDDWEAYSDSEHEDHDSVKRAIDLAIPQAQTQYTTQQGEFDATRATAIKVQDDLVLLKTTSADGSVEHLQKSVPELNAQYVTNLRGELLGGGLEDLFLNKDGSYKEDALERMMMAKDGSDIIKQMKERLTNQIQTEERVNILERTPVKPKTDATPQSNQEGVNPGLKNYLDGLLGGLVDKPVYANNA